MPSIETLNYLLGLGTLVMQIVGIGLLGVMIVRARLPDASEIIAPFERYGLWLAFALTLAASAMTLVYSEMYGLAPCGLCWLQRVCMYPLVVLFGIAAWRSDRNVADYAIVLSVLGGIVALYQHYLQMGGTEMLPCPASGPSLDCAERFLFEFGYITFPLMSATLFAFIVLLMIIVRRAR